MQHRIGLSATATLSRRRSTAGRVGSLPNLSCRSITDWPLSCWPGHEEPRCVAVWVALWANAGRAGFHPVHHHPTVQARPRNGSPRPTRPQPGLSARNHLLVTSPPQAGAQGTWLQTLARCRIRLRPTAGSTRAAAPHGTPVPVALCVRPPSWGLTAIIPLPRRESIMARRTLICTARPAAF